MKNITCALLASAVLSTAAFAEGKTSATGFYAGANVGMVNTNAKYDYKNFGGTSGSGATITVNAANGESQIANTQGGKVNPAVGLMAGYGMQFGQGYAGVEVSVGYDNAKVTPYDGRDPNPYSSFQLATVKRTFAYGIAVRGGFFVSPSTLLFAKFGYEGGSFKAKSDMSATAILAAASDAAKKATQPTVEKKKSNSFVVGLGMDVFVTKNLFLRGEYTHLFGPSIKLTQNIDAFQPVKGVRYDHAFKISQDAFKLGVGYKF